MTPLRVAPGGRYFETLEGEPFLFVGPNDAMTWPGLAPLFHRRDVAAAESYLRGLKANGVTTLRLMMEYSQTNGRFLEKPVGRFEPAMLRFWDDLFDLCEAIGLRVLLTPWDTFWMARRWKFHPYSAHLGGPAKSPTSFFTDEATIEAITRRFEFFIERYANRPALAAWDLFNELDPRWGGTAEQQGAVLARQSEAIRATERQVQGWTRPQTVSVFGPRPTVGFEELVFNHPSLDFCTTHIYYRGAIDFPRDTVAGAVAMGNWTRYGLENTPEGRPFLDSEHGPIYLFNTRRRWLEETFEAEYERHLMWAHLASGGAGSGMRWPARHPHVLTAGMQSQYLGLSRFAEEIDWRSFKPRDWRGLLSFTGAGARDFHRFAVGDGKQIVIFLLRRAPTGHRGVLPVLPLLDSLRLNLRGVEKGHWKLTFFDSREGEVLARRQLEATSSLNIELPPWEHSLAIALVRVGGSPT